MRRFIFRDKSILVRNDDLSIDEVKEQWADRKDMPELLDTVHEVSVDTDGKKLVTLKAKTGKVE